MPRTSEARATNTRVINKLPCAHSTIISENALPMPVVVTTLIIIPTATSKRAVETIVRTPSTTASNTSAGRIGVAESHDAPITLRIANAAALVGVRPATRKATSTTMGIIKCQPPFITSRRRSVSAAATVVRPRRFASMRTKYDTVRKYSNAGRVEAAIIVR